MSLRISVSHSRASFLLAPADLVVTVGFNMHWLKWPIIALALIQGGWFLFDGGRALVVGDYVTPAADPRAGELGPWSRVVSAAGFKPRGTFIKCLHLLLGAAWIAAVAIFCFRPATGWWGLLMCAILSLWYLPIGTFLGVVQLALLFSPQIRNQM